MQGSAVVKGDNQMAYLIGKNVVIVSKEMYLKRAVLYYCHL